MFSESLVYVYFTIFVQRCGSFVAFDLSSKGKCLVYQYYTSKHTQWDLLKVKSKESRASLYYAVVSVL